MIQQGEAIYGDDLSDRPAVAGGNIDRLATALNMQAATLHAHVEGLLQQLAPVLNPEPPTRGESLAEAIPECSGLAQNLTQTLGSLNWLSARIEGLRDRIDL